MDNYMRKSLRLATCVMLAVVLLMFTGCLPKSLEPLYAEKDLVTNDGLVGRWSGMDDDDKEICEFTYVGDKTYKCVIPDDEGTKSEFDARLVKLGDHLFLDLCPAKEPLVKMHAGNMYEQHLALMHSFFKVEIKEKQLCFHFFDMDRLTKLIQEKPNLIPCRVTTGHMIFTASTEALQKFVIQQAGETNAFLGDGKPLIFVPAESAKMTGESPKRAPDSEKPAPTDNK